MSRLVVLSNRVKMPDSGPMAGGLAVALQDVLIGNSVIWMGWNGDIVDANDRWDGTTNGFKIRKKTLLGSAGIRRADSVITYITTAFTSKQYQHFYCGFANNVLWPLLHEQPELISQTPEDYAGYQAVNRLFALQLKKVLKPDDVIWVHDYHFLSVAYYCRQLGMRNRIGFFLHIPFAPLVVWQRLEQSAELIEHLAHYDVLGTQTQQDKINCLTVFQRYLKDSLLSDLLINTSYLTKNTAKSNRSNQSIATQLTLNLNASPMHCLTINAYPIGINTQRIQQQAIELSCQSLSSDFLSFHPTKLSQKDSPSKSSAQQIIAVDRIDYSKGLLERFCAYRGFLQQYPRYQNELKFLQIACPSRLDLPIYQQLYEKVTQTVSNINQQFSANEAKSVNIKSHDHKANDSIDHWQAITYSEKIVNHDLLMTAFWHSDVGWVNSLKDGMNLVAKEYIAAQNPDNPGVLVLSQYAGAAEQMQAAIMIDPHQPKSIIQGLKTALEMPLVQRQKRYQALISGLRKDNLHAWQQDFLEDLYEDKRCQIKGQQMSSRHVDAL